MKLDLSYTIHKNWLNWIKDLNRGSERNYKTARRKHREKRYDIGFGTNLFYGIPKTQAMIPKIDEWEIPNFKTLA